MKGYKGFDKDFECRGMRYEVGKEFAVDGELSLCENGLHFCKYPLDVFGYYNPASSKFAVVESNGDVVDENSQNDSKVCTNKLKVCAKVGISELAHAAVEYVQEHIDITKNQRRTNTGDRSAATNTGYRSAATNTGNMSAATNTGNMSAAVANGENSIAIAYGYESVAKGTIGSWIVISEWQETEYGYEPKDVKCFRVDGEKILPDTYYKLVNGEPKACEWSENE